MDQEKARKSRESHFNKLDVHDHAERVVITDGLMEILSGMIPGIAHIVAEYAQSTMTDWFRFLLREPHSWKGYYDGYGHEYIERLNITTRMDISGAIVATLKSNNKHQRYDMPFLCGDITVETDGTWISPALDDYCGQSGMAEVYWSELLDDVMTARRFQLEYA